MSALAIVAQALAAIEKSKLEYVVVGAFATGYHAFARGTNDADFVIAAPLSAIEQIAPFFPAEFQIDPRPQVEMMTGTSRWIIDVEGTEFRVEIFHLGGDPHHAEIFRRKILVAMPWFPTKVWTLTAEDLVIQKLRWGRPKDLEDVHNILTVQAHRFDWAYAEQWCTRHGNSGRFAAARAAQPADG